MDARWQNQTHHIELNGRLDYRGPLFSARFDPDTFEPEQLEVTTAVRPGDVLPLETVASMYVLLDGLRHSLPHIPTALPAGSDDIGKISHPGYPE